MHPSIPAPEKVVFWFLVGSVCCLTSSLWRPGWSCAVPGKSLRLAFQNRCKARDNPVCTVLCDSRDAETMSEIGGPALKWWWWCTGRLKPAVCTSAL